MHADATRLTAASSATIGASPEAPDRFATLTWAAGLAALLIVELALLTATFDTEPLDRVPSLWARLIGDAPQMLRLAITIALAIAVLGARRGWALPPEPLATGRRLRALAVHGVAFGGFASLTSVLIGGDVAALAHRPLWTLAWLAAGVATLGGWAGSIAPLGSWGRGALGRRNDIALGVLAGTAVWASGFITQEFWQPMARVTFSIVAWTLHLFFDRVIVNPATLVVGTPAFRVVISPECSGYEGIGLITVFLSIYCWLYRRELRFPAALLLLPLGAATIWVVNVLRIVALVAIGSAGWKEVAAGGFHSQAGWIAFNAVALGFVALTHRAHTFRATPATEVHTGAPDTTAALLGPFVAVSGAAMITGAFTAGFDWLYPLRVLTGAIVLWKYRSEYSTLLRGWTWSWWPVAIGLMTGAAWLWLLPATHATKADWPAALGSAPLFSAAGWMVFRTVGYVAIAPLVEELAFRGYLTRRLAAADFERVPVGQFGWLPFVLSSLFFGAMHGSLWIAGTLAGAVFALALYRRRSLGDAVLAHATTNAVLAVCAWVTGRWSVWS